MWLPLWRLFLRFKKKNQTVFDLPPASLHIRVIHEKSNFKFLTSSSIILFINVKKYIMQNFSNFEKSLEGATSVSNFVHKVNEILEIKMFPAILSHL